MCQFTTALHSISCLCVLLCTLWSCQAQERASEPALVGGPCEGCEAIYEYGGRYLSAVDTLPDFAQTEPKLKITGTVYQQDGQTPAAGVILYIYHTNRAGVYPTRGDETGWARRHGYLRGWVQTGEDGRYTFYTFRPASYPDRDEPEHIHLTVKEPDRNAYYLDEYVFGDDPLLTAAKREELTNRGGSGIVQPVKQSGVWMVQRDLMLGRHLPNYE